MSDLIKVYYVASPSSEPVMCLVEEGRTVVEFLEDGQGITNFSNITVSLDGETVTMGTELYDGATISIAQKKTDSGSGSGVQA